MDYELPGWSQELFRWPPRHDFFVVYGGRGSGKTWTIAIALLIHGNARPIRFAVAREHKSAVEESAMQTLKDRAGDLSLVGPGGFTFKHEKVDHANGTHGFTVGLSTVSQADIKGLENVDILWIEEAQYMSEVSWELIRPTIRKDGAAVIVSFNPLNRSDAAYKTFVARKHPHAWTRKITFEDNPFFTKRNHRERLVSQEEEPDRYRHIWLGEPDDDAQARKVLPYALLRVCVDAWHLRPQPQGGIIHAGFDVADTGSDRNALAGRAGPELFDMDIWAGSAAMTTGKSTMRVHQWILENAAERLFFDMGGIGAGVRSEVVRLQEQFAIDAGVMPYSVKGVYFGGEVAGPDAVYQRAEKQVTNKQYFANRAAQMGWNVRMRAQNTKRLVDGKEDVDPGKCLFINPDIKNLETVLAQMAQPELVDSEGKLKIDKRPRPAGQSLPPSPDCYDAIILSFADDSRRGLRRV